MRIQVTTAQRESLCTRQTTGTWTVQLGHELIAVLGWRGTRRERPRTMGSGVPKKRECLSKELGKQDRQLLPPQGHLPQVLDSSLHDTLSYISPSPFLFIWAIQSLLVLPHMWISLGWSLNVFKFHSSVQFSPFHYSFFSHHLNTLTLFSDHIL